jgi:prepilin-type N-terminal cleavage/methylation domain-containing protein
MRTSANRQNRPGFTLVELLVVIAIIVVLIGLLLPSIQLAREASNRTACQNNLHQLAIAVHTCHGTYGNMPPLYGNFPNYGDGTNLEGSWFVHLLPYVGEDALFNMVNDDVASSGTNATIPSPVTTTITYTYQPGSYVPSGTTTTTVSYNGHSQPVTTTQWTFVPSGPPVTVTQTIPAGTPTPHGINLPGVANSVHKILNCPSDVTRYLQYLVHHELPAQLVPLDR